MLHPFQKASRNIAPVHSGLRHTTIAHVRVPNTDCSRPFPTASRTIAPVHSRQSPVLLFAFPTPTYKTRTANASEGPFRTASRNMVRVPNADCSRPFLTASRTIAPVHSLQLPYYCSRSQHQLRPVYRLYLYFPTASITTIGSKTVRFFKLHFTPTA